MTSSPSNAPAALASKPWSYRRGRAFGELFCGVQAVLRDDFDTSPSEAFILELWTWACGALNGAPVEEAPLRGSWRVANGYLCCGTLRIACLPLGVDVEDLTAEQGDLLDAVPDRLNRSRPPAAG